MLTLEVALQNLPGPANVIREFHSESANTVALIEINEQRSVLRIRPSANVVTTETRIQDAAASIQRAPRVIWSSPEKGIWLSEFWDAPGLVPGELTREDIDALSACLADIHTLSCKAPEVDLPSIAESYSAQVSTCDVEAANRAASELITAFGKVSSREPVLCHMDPTLGNWVSAGQPGLIDWEYAGCCDPLFDFAATVNAFALRPAESVRLLQSLPLTQTANLAEDWPRWLEIISRLTTLWRLARRATSHS